MIRSKKITEENCTKENRLALDFSKNSCKTIKKIFEPLSEFLRKQSSNIDIFCFQEVFNNGKLPSGYEKDWSGRLENFSDLKRLLPNFNPSKPSGQGLPLRSCATFLAQKTTTASVKSGVEYPIQGRVSTFL